MKKKQELKKILAAALGFSYAALGLAPATADDTDIFFGGVGNDVVKPNVMFILDNSNSMAYPIHGTGSSTSRIQLMKNAFKNIMNNATGINVGLMRFNDPGGSVMFPVTDIDSEYWGDAASVPQIDQSSDDANENLASDGGDGSVYLDKDYLVFGFYQHSTTEIQAQVSTRNDDAEESYGYSMELNGRAWDINSNQVNGVRFQNLDIPRGAGIESAFITFTARSNDYNPLSIRLYGEASANAGTFTSNDRNISHRAKTASSVVWEPGNWSVNETYSSPDLSPIVQEITDNDLWVSGNSVAFIQTYESGDGTRAARTYNDSSKRAPMLEVKYHSGPESAQATGLRFQDVGIPQGATVTKAYIEFTPKVSSIPGDTLSLNIKVEDSADAGQYKATSGDISSASYFSSSVTWDAGDWVKHETVKSPDLTTLVQQVVDRSDWCGGNAMAFKIQPDNSSSVTKRVAYSYDEGTSKQPRLVVEYDKNSIPSGACQQVTIRRQITERAGDAEQYPHYNHYINNDENTINLKSNQVNGFRFTDLPLKPGAKIQKAQLIFTASESDSGQAKITLKVQDAVNPDNFSENRNDIGSRATINTAKVNWNRNSTPALTDWTKDLQYTSPDLSELIQPLVDKSSWNSSDNAIAFIQTLSGNDRHTYAWDWLPGAAAALEVKVKTSDIASRASDTSVRAHLIGLVEKMEPRTYTPIVDTLYEAARYFRGDSVYWGKEREHDGVNSNTADRWKRVSNMDSLTGGNHFLPVGCTEEDLDSTLCAKEAITGNPEYLSPIKQGCQANYIVLLTDGEANKNNSASLIKNYIGHSGSCSNTSNKGSEECSEELVKWLASTEIDHAPSINGDNTIQTFTIAFALNDTHALSYLETLARQGNGKFLQAGSEGELTNAFNVILQDILKTDSTFVVPGTTASQFNLLTNYDDVYFALFKPNTLPRWTGNLKKYRFARSGKYQDEIVGQDNKLAVDPATGFFAKDVKSLWTNSSTADGPNVELGGAALQLPDNPDNRNVYTYYPGGNVSIKNNPLTEHNSNITTDMLDITDKIEPEKYRTNLLKWIRGTDVLDQDGDGDKAEARKKMGDPLHSAPVPVFYGGTEAQPDFTIFVSTNEGYLHAFDGDTGEELFAFMPQELLPNLTTLYDNAKTDKHPYGLDGSITKWVYDANEDGDIEKKDGDHVYLYFGMRRGGDYYYALDVTDRDNPKLMWILDGGTSPYSEMGQSWADPVKARVAYTKAGKQITREVLLISGGYDPDQDTNALRIEDNEGRAVFMVDATDTHSDDVTAPELIWSAGNGSNYDLNLSEMKYSIPGTVKAGDTDNDGLVDVMFVADVGGQIWRFDIDNGATLDNLVSGWRVADLAKNGEKDIADARRFYADVDATTYIQSGQTSIALTIGSGWRANPLNDAIRDRFYMIKQPFTKPAAPPELIEESDLYNATDNLIGSDDATTRNTALNELKNKKGWYIELEETGEKVLAQSFIFQSQLYFTTYEPNSSATLCKAAAGASYLYGVSLYDATPLVNVGDTGGSDAASRKKVLSGDSISPQGTPMITKNGKIKGLFGPQAIDLSGNLVKKTYWYQPSN